MAFDVEKIIKLIPHKNDNEICQMFKNAIDIIANDKPLKQDAMKMMSAIQTEWKSRIKLYKEGKYSPARPKQGMLDFLGYNVGHKGEPTKRRRYLIDFVISEELPLVQSPAYTLEWGDKKSRKRYKKLHRVIQGLITNFSNRKEDFDYDKAIIEWKEDLDYLEKKWEYIK